MATRLMGGRLLFAAALLSLGLVLGGFVLGDGLRRARMADRSVTMRGLAERDVTADLATWTMSFGETGADLPAAQAVVDEKYRMVRLFLARAGFAEAEIDAARIGVNQYYDQERGTQVVTVKRTVQLRTKDVMKARAAFAAQAELIRAGVALEEGSGMTYSFTGLNAIKPPMIADATRDARLAAERFARDSGAEVGAIRQATQGYFSIGARDGDVDTGEGASAGDSPFQKVRVVTTIDFYLR